MSNGSGIQALHFNTVNGISVLFRVEPVRVTLVCTLFSSYTMHEQKVCDFVEANESRSTFV